MAHIPSHHAQPVNAFLRDHPTPYLNFHRPCFFPENVLDDKRRHRRSYRYEHINTPYERLKAMPKSQDSLKRGLSFEILDQTARAMTDNQAAEKLQLERKVLLKNVKT